MKWWLPLLLGVAACTSGRPVRTYILALPAEPVAAAPLAASPSAPAHRLVIRRVLVPDYLDTTDILLRNERNEVKASGTGRWGERLSAGLTRLLTADLAARLPPGSIGFDTSNDSHRRLAIRIAALDLWPDGRCRLAAEWSLSDSDAPAAFETGSGTFDASSERISNDVNDARLVEVVAHVMAQLADSISRTVRESPGQSHEPDSSRR